MFDVLCDCVGECMGRYVSDVLHVMCVLCEAMCVTVDKLGKR